VSPGEIALHRQIWRALNGALTLYKRLIDRWEQAQNSNAA